MNKTLTIEEMAGTEEKREISGLLPMRVVFQHLPHKSTSIYSVEFPVKSTVTWLKRDIAERVKIQPEYQRWFYKGKELNDRDTILNKRMKRDETIFIEQIDPPGQGSEAGKLSEAAALRE